MNTKGHLTIEDIAKKAGVSVSTVSRVFNHPHLVSKKTRSKVQKIIEETNYSPNALARGLRKSSKTIGLLIPDITNLFFIELVKGIEQVLNQKGYSAFLCNTDWDQEKERHYLDLMIERRVEGLIIMATLFEVNYLEMLFEKEIHVVSIQNGLRGIDSVFSKDKEGAFAATEHLIGLGHRRIAFLGFQNIWDSMNNRLNGFREAMQKHGIPVDPNYTLFCNPHGNYGYELARKLFDLPQIPTAILAINDYMASGIYRACEEKKLKIPEDISVVGFDNTAICEWLYPRLTTVEQPIYEMGKQAALLLLDRISGEHDGICREIVLPTKLIVRNSTAKPRPQ